MNTPTPRREVLTALAATAGAAFAAGHIPLVAAEGDAPAEERRCRRVDRLLAPI